MTLDTCAPGISGGHAAASPIQGAPPELRCADSARMRGEPLQASAVRYSRFLLLEAPGGWGSSALDGTAIDSAVARWLAAEAAAADVNVLLIRRPGRQAPSRPGAASRPAAWALADASPEAERVMWGSWSDPADLLDLDLTADIPATAAETGPQRLVLVCTNGKRDQCCAIRGRPVAVAAAAATGWDTWECSHLGGHRFAATIMLLPTGDMFGWLDPASAVDVLRRYDAGQIMLSHYRGRAGQPALEQAALHATAVRLGDFSRGAFQASRSRPVPAPPGLADQADLWEVTVTRRAAPGEEASYRLLMAESKLAPSFLSCADGIAKAETRYEVLSFSTAE